MDSAGIKTCTAELLVNKKIKSFPTCFKLFLHDDLISLLHRVFLCLFLRIKPVNVSNYTVNSVFCWILGMSARSYFVHLGILYAAKEFHAR